MAYNSYCQPKSIVAPTIPVYQQHFHPQPVQVVHPIEVINQHYCVPVHHHIYTITSKDEHCSISSLRQTKRSNRNKARK